MPGILDSLLASDLALTALVSLVALLAVWLPFTRGLGVALRATRATRTVRSAELRGRTTSGERSEPMALLLLRVLRRSTQEGKREALPREFMIDAAKQYVLNEYDTHYARPLSMYANLLPPIGFIGTTAGLLLIFLSMHIANDALELSALAAALTSSIFALVAFALLEGAKIRLYTRLLASVDAALEIQRGAEAAAASGSR